MRYNKLIELRYKRTKIELIASAVVTRSIKTFKTIYVWHNAKLFPPNSVKLQHLKCIYLFTDPNKAEIHKIAI